MDVWIYPGMSQASRPVYAAALVTLSSPIQLLVLNILHDVNCFYKVQAITISYFS